MTDKEIMQALKCCTSKSISCQKCPLLCKSECERELIRHSFGLINEQQAEIEICAEVIKRQDKEIERLNEENKILSKNADTAFQDGLSEAQDLYAKQIKNEVRAEAIKEFVDMFDDELAKLRDTYFKRGMKDYSLVCEVIHDYLYRTLREMVGAIE